MSQAHRSKYSRQNSTKDERTKFDKWLDHAATEKEWVVLQMYDGDLSGGVPVLVDRYMVQIDQTDSLETETKDGLVWINKGAILKAYYPVELEDLDDLPDELDDFPSRDEVE